MYVWGRVGESLCLAILLAVPERDMPPRALFRPPLSARASPHPFSLSYLGLTLCICKPGQLSILHGILCLSERQTGRSSMGRHLQQHGGVLEENNLIHQSCLSECRTGEWGWQCCLRTEDVGLLFETGGCQCTSTCCHMISQTEGTAMLSSGFGSTTVSWPIQQTHLVVQSPSSPHSRRQRTMHTCC